MVRPVLFLLYINDIVNCVQGDSVMLKIFADDVKLSCVVPREKDIRSALCSALESINDWADKWQLVLANKKCAVLPLGYANPGRTYGLNAVDFENVTSFRDLGVIVDSDLKMTEHCNIISAKAKTRVGMIFRAFSSTNPALLTKAFITFVRPLLENCTTVWSPHLVKNINRIESVQRYFTWRVFRRCGLGHPEYKNRCAF